VAAGLRVEFGKTIADRAPAQPQDRSVRVDDVVQSGLQTRQNSECLFQLNCL
jgi:hypothetical protein